MKLKWRQTRGAFETADHAIHSSIKILNFHFLNPVFDDLFCLNQFTSIPNLLPFVDFTIPQEQEQICRITKEFVTASMEFVGLKCRDSNVEVWRDLVRCFTLDDNVLSFLLLLCRSLSHRFICHTVTNTVNDGVTLKPWAGGKRKQTAYAIFPFLR